MAAFGGIVEKKPNMCATCATVPINPMHTNINTYINVYIYSMFLLNVFPFPLPHKNAEIDANYVCKGRKASSVQYFHFLGSIKQPILDVEIATVVWSILCGFASASLWVIVFVPALLAHWL